MKWGKVFHPDDLNILIKKDPLDPGSLERYLIKNNIKTELLDLESKGYLQILGNNITILVSSRYSRDEQEKTFLHEGVHVYYGAKVTLPITDHLQMRCEELIEKEALRFYKEYPTPTRELFNKFIRPKPV